jgi:hypothetical protein
LLPAPPLGLDAFVEADARSCAAAVEILVTSLTSLPLSTQDKFLLLRSFLQARLTHLTRTTPWQRLSPHTAAGERQVLLAALLLVDHPPPEDLPADPVVAQVIFPLRFGGFGLHVTTTLEANAAFLAAAGTAEVAMQSAPAPFWPFHPGSPICASLTRQWAMLRDAVPGLWPGLARELEGTRLASILVHQNGGEVVWSSPGRAALRFPVGVCPGLLRGLPLEGQPQLLRVPASLRLVGHDA